MAGAMRKVGVYLGLLEDTDRYEDDYYDEEPAPAAAPAKRPVQAVRDEPAPVASLSERRRPAEPGRDCSTRRPRPGDSNQSHPV